MLYHYGNKLSFGGLIKFFCRPATRNICFQSRDGHRQKSAHRNIWIFSQKRQSASAFAVTVYFRNRRHVSSPSYAAHLTALYTNEKCLRHGGYKHPAPRGTDCSKEHSIRKREPEDFYTVRGAFGHPSGFRG